MLFRKHISILLVFFLLVSNLGLALNIHYCEDEIASVSLNTTSNYFENEKNCCGIVEKDSKCCKNKIVKTLEKTDQVVVKSFTFSPNYYMQEAYNSINCNAFKTNFKKSSLMLFYCDANAPPFYLLYNQFTFYA
jgi:hypothetical protein